MVNFIVIVQVLSHEAIVRLIKAFETPKEDCDALKETGPDDLYLGRYSNFYRVSQKSF